MTKSFNKSKQSCFRLIFCPISQYLGQKQFFRKIRLCYAQLTTSYEFLAPCQNSEKTNDTIPRKRPNRRKDGKTGRPDSIIPFIPLFTWDTANFKVLWPEWPHPFFDQSHPNIFQSTFHFHKYVSTCKKTRAFHHFVRQIYLFYIWFKNLKTDSDWHRVFWSLFQEPDFPRIWDLCGNTSNNINFHYG